MPGMCDCASSVSVSSVAPRVRPVIMLSTKRSRKETKAQTLQFYLCQCFPVLFVFLLNTRSVHIEISLVSMNPSICADSVAFSSLARILGGCSTVHSPPALYLKWNLARTH